MTNCILTAGAPKRIGFISTRFHGTDGVTLEAKKWAHILLIPQNILAIPMHVPLGLAFTEVVAETGLPTIALHHDFAWETITPADSSGRSRKP